MSRKKLIVVGQGYVGLPLAMRAVAAGYEVHGIDLDVSRISMLNEGRSYVEDVGSDELKSAINGGTYFAYDNYSSCPDFDFAVITVPTPLRERMPDISFIESAVQEIAKLVKKGSTVVLESTTYPGTTEEVVVPILESTTGLSAGVDFFVGYSPERIDPGNPVWNFTNTPKVVSGINQASLDKVSELYGSMVDKIVPVSSPKEAELSKLLENTFRHVNIALVNELMVFGNLLGVNVWETIEAAATKPFGFLKFLPGPGVGGHCLPVDPSYLSWQVKRKLGYNFRFVELANDINEHMPDYVFDRVASLLNEERKPINGSKVLLLGLSYKPNSSDIRESPSLKLIDLLNNAGAKLSALDPHVHDSQWPINVSRIPGAEVTNLTWDAIVIITNHDDVRYEWLNDVDIPVLDTRNVKSLYDVEKL